jgi:KDO2-lipid IV(A) lauroyltransferase
MHSTPLAETTRTGVVEVDAGKTRKSETDTAVLPSFRSRLIGRVLEVVLGLSTTIANRLSLDRLLRAGAFIGRSWVRLRLPRSRRVCDQLALAFPELSAPELDAMTVDVFEHLGRGLGELLGLRGRHRATLLDEVVVEGIEHLTKASALSRTGGVLVVSAHYGNWELAGVRLATLGLPISAVFRGLAQPILERALRDVRTADGSAAVDYEQLRIGSAGLGLVRALKAGRSVLALLDQNARRDEGVFVPFFGRPACVRTGPLKLAMRTETPIVAAFMRRDPTGRGHRLEFHPPCWTPNGTADADGALERCATEFTALTEAEIRRDPTQWIWTHRRWRTRPENSPASPKDPA